jgi:hypothetical protein
MPDQSLLVLLDEVRGKTIRLLNAIPPEYATWAPAGLQNTIVWHGGHAYILLECLTMGALGRTPEVPDGWFDMFSWESHPEQVAPDRWPPLADVIVQLERQHKRMRRLINKLSDEKLEQRSVRHSGEAVRRAIVHALHDEACHCGEIHLLRKLRAVVKPLISSTSKCPSAIDG